MQKTYPDTFKISSPVACKVREETYEGLFHIFTAVCCIWASFTWNSFTWKHSPLLNNYQCKSSKMLLLTSHEVWMNTEQSFQWTTYLFDPCRIARSVACFFEMFAQKSQILFSSFMPLRTHNPLCQNQIYCVLNQLQPRTSNHFINLKSLIVVNLAWKVKSRTNFLQRCSISW